MEGNLREVLRECSKMGETELGKPRGAPMAPDKEPGALGPTFAMLGFNSASLLHPSFGMELLT